MKNGKTFTGRGMLQILLVLPFVPPHLRRCLAYLGRYEEGRPGNYKKSGAFTFLVLTMSGKREKRNAGGLWGKMCLYASRPL